MLVRLVGILAVIMLVAAGCSTQQPTAPNLDQLNDDQSLGGFDDGMGDDVASAAKFGFGYGHQREVTFLVRIENVSTGMTLHLSNGETAPAPHSPGVWAVTRLFNPLFKVGRFDQGLGLEQQAEDGNPAILAGNIENKPFVKSSGVFTTPVGDAGPGPATPGKAYEFMVTASPGDHLSFTSMFGQSNDLFYAPGVFGIPLFTWGWKPVDGDVTRFVRLWDAGTEVNQEPGLGPDQAPRQSGPNTGASEHKRVFPVRDQYTYPATNEVIKVTITPVDAMS